MTTRETRKAVTQPNNKTSSSVWVMATPCAANFTAFKRLAPSMVGMARKKENSEAAVRDSPRSIAPRMVEPEREVPGIREST